MHTKARIRRVLVVRNQLPVAGDAGGHEVVLDILDCLNNAGIETGFISLSRHCAGRPWYRLAPMLTKISCVMAPSNILVFNRLVRTSPLAWAIWLEACLAGRLPVFLSPLLNKVLVMRRIGEYFNEVPSKGFCECPERPDFQFIEKCMSGFSPDAIMIDYTWLSPVFSNVKSASAILKIVLGHEVIHLRAAAFKRAGLLTDLPDWSQEDEVNRLHDADVVTVETAEELALMKKLLPGKTVLALPRGMSLHERGETRVNGRCLFVGSGASANVSGLSWFLEKVWPVVLAIESQANLEVCGGVCDSFMGRNYPMVQFLGKVPSLAPHYEVAAVCVLPLLAGSGFKTKLVEALSYGCACVATPTGVAGAETIAGTAVLVEEDSAGFGKAVARVLGDATLRDAMERASATYAKNELSPEKTYRPILDLLREPSKGSHPNDCGVRI